jgi:hypothetical protein
MRVRLCPAYSTLHYLTPYCVVISGQSSTENPQKGRGMINRRHALLFICERPVRDGSSVLSVDQGSQAVVGDIAE